MTAQISDTVIFNNDKYLLIGENISGLFHPSQCGIKPEMYSTACYRGHYCTYELKDNGMYLQELYVYDPSNQYPPISSVAAKPIIETVISQGEDGEWRERQEITHTERRYSGLKFPIQCTGRLRIAKDMVPGLYIHMGFQKASAFKHVLDITLFKGTIANLHDRSAEMAAKRGNFKDAYESGDIMATISDAFALDIDLE